jgi:transcriptional regulator with XRE-family HTH domain
MFALSTLISYHVRHSDLQWRDLVREPTFRTVQAGADIGSQLAAWRKLRGLTAQQVAERAGVTRQTVGRLERGDLAVGTGVFLSVCRALGILERVVEATDPYETPFGRARADQILPKRVRP